MKLQYLVNTLTALALIVSTHAADNGIEESTVSPIAETMIADTGMSTSTEKPSSATASEKSDKSKAEQALPQSVGDFIIHPLIAFKPRIPEDNIPAGKQAAENATSIFPWTFFGYPNRQGMGGSVSTIAGQVSNWITDRITFPGLETPVRESTTTTSTTTTTPGPEIVVRVQHKPSTRKPIIKINNQQNSNRRQRPNRVEISEEEDDDEDDYQQSNYDDEDEQEEEEQEEEQADDQQHDVLNNRKQNAEEEEVDEDEIEDDAEENNDEENYHAEEDDDDDEAEEEELIQRPTTHIRPVQQQKRRFVAAQRQPVARPNKHRYQPFKEQYEDENDNEFYYGVRPSTKRSQNQLGLIQLGQQSLINQIRQLTGGQTPAEVAAAQRRPQRAGNKRRQQGTLFINRNGQYVYLAPELANVGPRPHQVVISKRVKPGQFPQPPLTVPLRRKGRPTQYITIPWSQLGISPPNQLVGITEGLQSQPLILNIPQSAINQMQNGGNQKNQHPLITADSVPLLAEASLMDIFKPPKIPPSRNPKPTKKPSTTETTATTAEPTVAAILPQRIRAGTPVVMAPAMTATVNASVIESVESVETQAGDQSPNALRNTETQYIIIGADEEPGLTRHAQPVLGEARYVPAADFGPYLEALSRRRLAFHKVGRALEKIKTTGSEQRIPVQVIVDGEEKQEQRPAGETKAVPQLAAAVISMLPNSEDAAAIEAVNPDVEKAVIPEAIPTMDKVLMPEVAAVIKTAQKPETVPIMEKVMMPDALQVQAAIPAMEKVMTPESMMMTE